jgi:hypothetical protein
MDAKRQEAEELIYKVMDTLDKTKSNSEYYKTLFAEMSDEEFKQWCSRTLPIRFHTKPFEIEPKMDQIEKALSLVGIPLLEKIYLPYLYKNKEGKPVASHEGIVGYIHLKKMKQFLTKKNHMSTEIAKRDMKSGALISHDKGGRTSDREMEAMAVQNLNKIMKEFSTYRADYMDAKSAAYNSINTTGRLSMKDIPIEQEDSLAKMQLNTYMIGSMLQTNIINVDYYLPKTLKDKKKRTIREIE